MSTLRLSLLGEPQIEANGRLLTLKRRKNIALLAYLALTNTPHRRETLATLLWPEQESERAYAALRQALWLLRKKLPDWIDSDRETVSLSNGYWLDIDAFQQATSRLHDTLPLAPLRQAADLYRGPFLQGLTLPDTPAFSDWQFFQEETLENSYAKLLQTLVTRHKKEQDWETAVIYARRWVDLDPLDEIAQRQLLWLYGQLGQRSAVRRQYEQLTQLLATELHTTPDPATRDLVEQLGKQTDTPQNTTPAPPAATTPGNLPTLPTPFIGRHETLSQVRHLFTTEPACHLLTLVGPGGIGKTRLAIQVAQQLQPQFADGTFLIPLAHTHESRLLFAAIAEALQFAFYGGLPAEEQLLNHLANRQILLILDNFEHLVGSANLLSQIVARAPQVKLLVTSRERLHLQEEWGVVMRGMSYPTTAEAVGEAELLQFSAIQLFWQRARQISSDFTLQTADIPHLLRICQLVDGNPLGLELATAWVSMMSLAEISREIERNLDFLSTALVNVPERHRSMRAVFEYSWQFLSEAERQALQQLAVFRGGFDAAAVAAVVGGSHHDLRALVEKSLVRRSEAGQYELHTLVRQYGVEKLQTAVSTAATAQTRHSRYYAQFMQQQEQQLKGSEQQRAINQIVANIDNIWAGWRWAVAHLDLTAVQQYLEGLWLFGEMRGWFQASANTFAQAASSLRRPPPGQTSEPAAQQQIVLAQLLARQGCATFRLGFLAQGQALLQESLALLQPHAPATNREIAFNLLWLGAALSNPAEKATALRDSYQLFLAEQDKWGAAFAQQVMAITAEFEGDYGEAASKHQQAMAQMAQLGDQRLRAFSTNALGRIAHARGDYAQAASLLAEALAVRQAFGDRVGMAQSQLALGITAVSQGNLPQAEAWLRQSLALSQEINNRAGTANALIHLGSLRRLQAAYDEASQLLQQGLALVNVMAHQRIQVLVQQNLGLLAQAEGKLTAAATHLAQGLHLAQQLGFDNETALLLCQQALLLLAQGDEEAALASWQQAVDLATAEAAAPLLLLLLFVAARVYTKPSEKDTVVREWLTAVFQHPATPYETRQAIRCLSPQLVLETAVLRSNKQLWEMIQQAYNRLRV